MQSRSRIGSVQDTIVEFLRVFDRLIEYGYVTTSALGLMLATFPPRPFR